MTEATCIERKDSHAGFIEESDETIIIGDDIEVMVVAITGDKVRLGISAPKKIRVDRKEMSDRIAEENRVLENAEK